MILFFYYYFLFFLIIEQYSVIPAVIIKIFNPTAALAIPRKMQTNEAKAEIETQTSDSKKLKRANLQRNFKFSFSSHIIN